MDLFEIDESRRMSREDAAARLRALADALAKAGHEHLALAGTTMLLRDIRTRVPAYYFPISSERDLVAKVLELHAQNVSKVVPTPSPPPESGVEIKWSRATASIPAGVSVPRRLEADAALQLESQSGGIPSGVGKLS